MKTGDSWVSVYTNWDKESMNTKIINIFLYQYQRALEWKLKRSFDGSFVAMFHQVEENHNKWYDKRYAISFSHFQRFVYNLQDGGYEFISPYDIYNGKIKKRILLSFDDVFDGVFYVVYPFLKEKNIPFVIFPAIDKLQEEGYLNSEMLLKMINEYPGCYIGAHSISHNNLRYLSKAESKREIIESGEILENIAGKNVDLFAYPFGSADAVGRRERNIAKSKYKFAFGTVQGGVASNTDRGYIPRININDANYCSIIR